MLIHRKKNHSDVPSSYLKQVSSLTAYRLMIVWRFMLALLGGYVIAALSAILIAEIFSESRSSAAIAGTLIAFVLQVAAFIWGFMVNSTVKASLGILITAAVLISFYKIMGL